MWQIAQQTHWDNMHYQFQQGYLDREYYEDAFKERVVRLAPTWRALGLTGGAQLLRRDRAPDARLMQRPAYFGPRLRAVGASTCVSRPERVRAVTAATSVRAACAHLVEDRGVAVERLVARRVGLVIADVSVDRRDRMPPAPGACPAASR